jgi:hypothetical protein
VSVRGTILPAAMVVIGVAILVRTLAAGATLTGLLLGVLFCLAGGLRMYADRRS